MRMIEMLAKKQEKRPRLSKMDGPKSHVPYGAFTRSAGRSAGREFKKTPTFQQLARYASAKNRKKKLRCVVFENEKNKSFTTSEKIKKLNME